jgi:hypothetical protein
MEGIAVRIHCPPPHAELPGDPAAFKDAVAAHLRHDPVAFALATDTSHWATGRGWPHADVTRHDWAGAPAAGTSFEVNVDLGGSLEDGWALAHLLLALTAPHTNNNATTSFGRRCFVTVESAEGDMGDFLLVEAADSLADWCCPEVMAHRVVLYDGRVAIIPPAPNLQPADGGLVRRAMLAAWGRYSLDGSQPPPDGQASPVAHEEPRPLASIDVAMRFFADIVVPTVCQVTGAATSSSASTAAPFAAALERTLFPSVAVTEAIGVRAQREAADLVRHRQRVCALMPLFAAAVLQRDPTASEEAHHTTATSLAARALVAFRQTVPEALKTAGGAEALLAQIRGSPFMPAAATADSSDGTAVDHGDLVKISLSLPRYSFAFALFTDLPAALGGGSAQPPQQQGPPLRPTPLHVAELGAKIAIGLTCLMAEADAVLLGRVAAVTNAGTGTSRNGAASVDVAEAPPADLGDGFAWMHDFAAESAAQDAAWTKGDLFADLATRLAAADSDDADSDDNDDDDDGEHSSETASSGASDASPTAHADHPDEEQRWSSTGSPGSSTRRSATAAKDDAAWRWAQDAADALAAASVDDGDDVNDGGVDDADGRGALRQWEALLNALAADADLATTAPK